MPDSTLSSVGVYWGIICLPQNNVLPYCPKKQATGFYPPQFTRLWRGGLSRSPLLVFLVPVKDFVLRF
jgi:hypothetical protein